MYRFAGDPYTSTRANRFGTDAGRAGMKPKQDSRTGRVYRAALICFASPLSD